MAPRRILALAALPLLAMTALPAPPAGAHAEHGNFVQWRGPSDTEPVSGEEVHIRARLSFGEDGVQSWAVEVVAPPDVAGAYPGFGTICESSSSGQAPLAADVDCVWDTTAYPVDDAIAHNGRYLIRITARNGQRRMFSPESEPHSSERTVRVTNGTEAPSGVRLAAAENRKQATLQWAANPEPDVVRYVVQEQVGSADWKTIGQTGPKVTTYTRKLGAPGTYRYQVAALRSSGEGDETVASPWSAPAGEPKQVVVAEPPKPTTTTTTAPPARRADAGEDPRPHSPEDPPASSPEDDPGSPAGSPLPEGVPVEPEQASAEAPSSGGRRAAVVTPIAPGQPGSVETSQSFSGKVVDNSAKPAPDPRVRVANQPDGPYSETLPYPKQEAQEDPDLDTVDAADTEAAIRLPASDPDEDARALLVPLAGGLLLFVFAMLGLHVSRRSAAALEAE